MPNLSARHTTGWQKQEADLLSRFPQNKFERSTLVIMDSIRTFNKPLTPESAAYLDADESEFYLNNKHALRIC